MRRRRESHQLPPGRHGLPRSFVVQNQRERILAAVADVTTVVGYAETTVKDIIEAAGISRRTFYEHFRNKDEAYLAAYDEAAERLLVKVRAAWESQTGFVERIRAGMEAAMQFLAADPAFAHMCIVEVMAAGPDAIRRRNTAVKAFADLIERSAAELLDEPSSSPLTAQTVVGGIYDVLYTRIQQGDVSELPALAPELVYATLLPYLGPVPAGAARARGAFRNPIRTLPEAP